MKKFLSNIKTKLFTKVEKEHSEAYMRRIAFLNKYSLLFHVLISCALVFIVEVISRRNFLSACSFVGGHTFAFLYNAFIVFASLSFVYIFRRRAFARIIISGFWIILGIINGCILSNRVTPFGFTDLKCIPDLLAMNNTNYFTAEEATIVVIGLGLFALFCVVLFIKGPRFQGKIHKIVVLASIVSVLFIGLPITTSAAQKSNVVASYFSNIAQGYENYGFIYGFSSSVVDRGMKKPDTYNEQHIDGIEEQVAADKKETTIAAKNAPNIICVLLESFCDPDEINFLNYNEDPIPTFHKLEKKYTSGYLTVPVVGAGTANTEFEVLTGMSMKYFGTGEYPYKTILKKTDCESTASDLASIGYGTHAVHNNGGNFYSRANAFSMMGFDSFTSKELLDITDYTPLGNWPTDDILIDATTDAMDVDDNPDFVYTITVEGHGAYPTCPVEEDPAIKVIAHGKTEEEQNAWSYYINRIYNVDDFVKNYIEALDARGEDTLVIMFGDHLPTMGLTDSEVATGDLYKTKYFTWNNFGMEKIDEDLASYQLVSEFLNRLDIHNGNINAYHQTSMAEGKKYGTSDYMNPLKMLQYDILYGDRYVYEDGTKYTPSDIVMGVNEVTVDSAYFFNGRLHIYGDEFTKWSKVFVNGEQVPTKYESGQVLSINSTDVTNGDTIKVCQMGSSNTVFRESNEFKVYDPNYVEEEPEIEETEEDSEE